MGRYSLGGATGDINATTVTVTDNESTDESNALVFVADADVDGGDVGLESDGTLTYNPSTGTVTATELALAGSVHFDSSPADETVSGITATFTAGEDLVRGEVV